MVLSGEPGRYQWRGTWNLRNLWEKTSHPIRDQDPIWVERSCQARREQTQAWPQARSRPPSHARPPPSSLPARPVPDAGVCSRKLSAAAARTEHAPRRGGPGVRKLRRLRRARRLGVAGSEGPMGSAGAAGSATWVLAGGVLAAALALPAGPGDRGRLPAGPGPLGRPLGGQSSPDLPAAPGAGPERTAQVRRARP